MIYKCDFFRFCFEKILRFVRTNKHIRKTNLQSANAFQYNKLFLLILLPIDPKNKFADKIIIKHQDIQNCFYEIINI